VGFTGPAAQGRFAVSIAASGAPRSSVGARRAEVDGPDGKFSVDAELLDYKDGAVRLKKEDGHIVVLPAEKLSEPDQAYLRD